MLFLFIVFMGRFLLVNCSKRISSVIVFFSWNYKNCQSYATIRSVNWLGNKQQMVGETRFVVVVLAVVAGVVVAIGIYEYIGL